MMINAPFSQADHFRARAEECRAIAAMFHNEVTREKMLRVADGYDRMAQGVGGPEDKPGDGQARAG